jgi:hypothetical protein
VLVDPGENKSLKTITSPAAKTIKTEVENAIKKLMKK